jgi:hypothetical protein
LALAETSLADSFPLMVFSAAVLADRFSVDDFFGDGFRRWFSVGFFGDGFKPALTGLDFERLERRRKK